MKYGKRDNLMKKIVIIGANEFQNPLILKAKEMNYETHVFAWQVGAIGETTADYFYPISIVEKDRILEVCKQIKPDAVATIASDLGNITVQYLASRLGLPCNSDECIEISTNKYQMRCALRDHGIKTPHFEKVSDAAQLGDAAQFTFPVIVKPTDRSGSRGITKVLNPADLPDAVKVSAEQSFEKMAIVEEYIEGPEFSCECISYNGNHELLTVTKKFTTGAPHFIETGHMEPAGLSDEMMQKIQKTVFASLDALKIQNGASHSEFRITSSGDIGIIEIGSRMGGDCIGSDLVRLSTGKDFVKMVIQVAAGQKPDLTPVKAPECAAIRFIFGQKDLDILEKIKKDYPEHLFFVSPIDPIGDHEIVDSGTRYGFYIMTASSTEEMYQISGL